MSEKCNDCDQTITNVFDPNEGNGKCSHCHGKGKVYGIRDQFASDFMGGEDYHTCEVCDGSGICQTCNGSGHQ